MDIFLGSFVINAILKSKEKKKALWLSIHSSIWYQTTLLQETTNCNRMLKRGDWQSKRKCKKHITKNWFYSVCHRYVHQSIIKLLFEANNTVALEQYRILFTDHTDRYIQARFEGKLYLKSIGPFLMFAQEMMLYLVSGLTHFLLFNNETM